LNADGNYRLLIVEDEPLERKALTMLIGKLYPLFELDTASTAPEFEKKALDWNPDIVLLDIKIPGGSGIESLRKLRNKGFTGEVIMITAYDVFQYAQQAIGLRVDAFLVKPVSEKILKEHLEKALVLLNDKRDRRKKLQQIGSFIRKNRGTFTMGIIQELARTKTPTSDMAEIMTTLGLPPSRPCRLFGVICIYQEGFNTEDQFFLWQSLENEFGEDMVSIPWINPLSLFFLPVEPGGETIEETASRFLNVISSHNIGANLAYGGLVTRLDQIAPAVEEIEEILEESLLGGMGRFLLREPAHQDQAITSGELLEPGFEKIQKLIDDGFSQNRYDLVKLAQHKLMELTDSNTRMDMNLYKFLIVGVLGRISQILYDFKCDSESLKKWVRRQLLNILSPQTPLAVEKVLSEALEQAWTIRETASDPAEMLIRQTLNYINETYEEISLEKAADHVHVSPSYLSRLFHRVTRVRFVDHVKNVRIEKARTLLQEGMSVKDTSISVGYGNIGYFSTLFKSSTGLSPTEYKKSISSTETVH
jgi:two-component system response regulator YesN